MMLEFLEEATLVAVPLVQVLMGTAYLAMALYCLEYLISVSLVSPVVVFVVEDPWAVPGTL